MNKSQVSVIIPTHNRSELILRAVDSVMKQTFSDFELWIIDDGSTDETEEKIKQYGKTHDPENKINYLKTDNNGVSSARNFGVKKSDGRLVAFLDSDDEWLPEKLQKQINYLEKNSYIRLVHGDEIWIRNGKRVNPRNIHKKSGGNIFKSCLKLCLISPSAVMMERNLIIEMGGWDEEFVVCEDYDLWLKVTSMHEVGFINEPIINKYGGHEDQLSRKYFAMDYWRIKSMDRISRAGNLEDGDILAVADEIIRKGVILLSGYEKHKNFVHYDEVKRIVERAHGMADSDCRILPENQ